MIEKRKVEFIESYIKIGNSDYQWHDNHGELIRCKDCKYHDKEEDVNYCDCGNRPGDWFCADGERKE